MSHFKNLFFKLHFEPLPVTLYSNFQFYLEFSSCNSNGLEFSNIQIIPAVASIALLALFYILAIFVNIQRLRARPNIN